MAQHWVLLLIAWTLAMIPTVATQAKSQQPSDAAWVLFVDDLHIDFRNTGWVRAFIQALTREVVGPSDLVALRTSGSPRANTGMVQAARFGAGLREVSGASLKPRDLQDVRNAEEMESRSRSSLSGAAAAVELLAMAKSRTRGFVYIGNGPWRTPNDELQAFAAAVRRSGVTVFVIDARDLPQTPRPAADLDPVWAATLTMARDNLNLIAHTVGGIALLDDAGTTAALDAIRRAMPR